MNTPTQTFNENGMTYYAQVGRYEIRIMSDDPTAYVLRDGEVVSTQPECTMRQVGQILRDLERASVVGDAA